MGNFAILIPDIGYLQPFILVTVQEKKIPSVKSISSKAGGLGLLGFRDEGRIILPLLERTRGKLISFTG